MKLKEAIERLKNLQDWYKEGNMSTTIESSELESICIVLQVLEANERELESARKFIDEEEETIVEKNNKICELEYKNIELQKENEGIKARVDKYLQGGNETLRLEHEETLKYYHENYISKDKIKEKLEEIKEIADEDNMDEFVKINLLEELLKGE